MELSCTHLRYLYAIYEISKKVPDVRSSNIVECMKVSKPSVCSMLETLMDRHLIVKRRYGKIYLTDEGYLTAKAYGEHINQLTGLIPRMQLNLTAEEIQDAACALAAVLPEKCWKRQMVETGRREDEKEVTKK